MIDQIAFVNRVMPDVRCTTFTVRKWEDSASEYPRAPQSSAVPGSLVVVFWMPRSNTARKRAVSLSESMEPEVVSCPQSRRQMSPRSRQSQERSGNSPKC